MATLDEKAVAAVVSGLRRQIAVLELQAIRTSNGTAMNYPATAADRLRAIIADLKAFDAIYVDHPAIEFQKR
jgi:hypothetical protein